MNWNAKRRQALGATRLPTPTPAPTKAPAPAPALVGTLESEGGEVRFALGAEAAGLRLDRRLAEELAKLGQHLSRTRLRALIESGCVSLDGAAVLDPSLKPREGQLLRLVVPAAVAPQPLGEAIPLAVVYEDEHLLVVDKQAGLVVHPAAGHETGTLVNALIAHCGDSLSGIGGVKRPGLVHRLDKDTSGLLVVAKSDAAHRGLAELFADHGRSLGLVREYQALVWGAPDRSVGSVEAAIGRHPRHREKQAVVRAGGREAVTHWRVERIFEAAGAPVAALTRCRLETGRTHQIRVHMASIGHPLMGDPLYGAGFKSKAERLSAPARNALEALGRQALHAARLGFPHPMTGRDLLFESPPPPDLSRLIEALRDGNPGGR